jgi:hypothetical protein
MTLALIALAAVITLLCVVAAAMRSSQLTRQEEARE